MADAHDVKLEEARKVLALMDAGDWYLVERYYTEQRDGYRELMENANTWDQFVAARAIKRFIEGNLLPMRDALREWVAAEDDISPYQNDGNPLED